MEEPPTCVKGVTIVFLINVKTSLLIPSQPGQFDSICDRAVDISNVVTGITSMLERIVAFIQISKVVFIYYILLEFGS